MLFHLMKGGEPLSKKKLNQGHIAEIKGDRDEKDFISIFNNRVVDQSFYK